MCLHVDTWKKETHQNNSSVLSAGLTHGCFLFRGAFYVIIFILKGRFCCVAQAGFECLCSSNPPEQFGLQVFMTMLSLCNFTIGLGR